MAKYYVNSKAQSNGDHEVHKEACIYMPTDKKYLGDFASCRGAVAEAKKTHSRVNGCFYCSKDCHTT